MSTVIDVDLSRNFDTIRLAAQGKARERPVPTVIGGLQFSSAAWRIQARDRWIGWDEASRARHLPQVVNNSRLLLLPWVHIQNFASATLARALRRLPADWHLVVQDVSVSSENWKPKRNFEAKRSMPDGKTLRSTSVYERQ
jgi:hypothetical protein